MVLRASSPRGRRAFTLIELLVVITIILLISGMFLSLSPGDGGGLPAGQRVIGTSLRAVRAMALMNRGTLGSGIPYNARYRLLILNDPDDAEGHLRTVCVAVGAVTAADAGGDDPATIHTDDVRFKWFAPEAPVRLPKGVYLVPPRKADGRTTVNFPAGWTAEAKTRRSIIGDLSDTPSTGGTLDISAGSPRMTFAPVNQPTALSQMGPLGAKQWYYVEIQPTGQSNHLGRVLLVLALGGMRPPTSPGSPANLDVSNQSQFAAVAVRPSGEFSMTNDSNDMDKPSLEQ